MTIAPAAPIVVRIFEPISFVFQEGAMPQPLCATVAPPNCILCDGLAAPPSRMGWLEDRVAQLEERLKQNPSASRDAVNTLR